MPGQDDMAGFTSFSDNLRSAPTAAIHNYRTLYATQGSSPAVKAEFEAASMAFIIVLTLQDWEMEVSADKPALGSRDMFHGYVEYITDINMDIWDAIVNTGLPFFWLDVLLEQTSVDNIVRASCNGST